jgi:adenosylcobinamide kinase/adenosylcobinamide-phosphate guanylyltransferase
MSRIIFITGGARSGKSRVAENIAECFGAPLCYIATGQPKDTEMAERIAAHRARRGDKWQTVEEPLELARTISSLDRRYRAMLVDCITLWITNLLLLHNDPGLVLKKIRTLAESFPNLRIPLILVSNEVGMGIVPENALARTFRDLAGEANGILAAAADEVHVMFSGIPLRLK